MFKGILHRPEWGDFDVGSIELTLAGRFRDRARVLVRHRALQ